MKHRGSLYLFVIFFTNIIYSSEKSIGFWGEIKFQDDQQILHISKDHYPSFLEGIKDLALADCQNEQKKTYSDLRNIIISKEPYFKMLIQDQGINIYRDFFITLYEAYIQEIDRLKTEEIYKLRKASESVSQPKAFKLVPVHLLIINGAIVPVIKRNSFSVIPLTQNLIPVAPRVQDGKILFSHFSVENSNRPVVLTKPESKKSLPVLTAPES